MHCHITTVTDCSKEV